MADFIAGVDALEAWRAGVNTVVANKGSVFHLFTTIERPTAYSEAWLTQHSPHYRFGVGDSVADVINTIFPVALAARVTTRGELYERYNELHSRAAKWKRNRSAWGTYFQRLTRFPPDGVNQLERVIEKLGTWSRRNTTGLVLHLSSPSVDAPRTRGGPCWHFGQVLWQPDDSLDLAVVYRNHDFFNKALGNFIGLGQLLAFMARETGKVPGRICCHSMHAYSDKGIGKLKELAL